MITRQTILNKVTLAYVFFILSYLSVPLHADERERQRVNAGNFGLPGMFDVPIARHFPDGELVITQQIHENLWRSGITFQALPRLGLSFRYSGHGKGGSSAYGRVNYDRSFDAHIKILNERKFWPEISIGLRDFIGTGWYSSEYIVGTKSIGKIDLTAGLGFGRLAGLGKFSNPLSFVSSRFEKREQNNHGKGGTLGTINWFHGQTSAFYGLRYYISDRLSLAVEYTPDQMSREYYLDVDSPWNIGASYQINEFFGFSAQYLHGNQLSVAANISINPDRPALLGGKELAPVPMRLRPENTRSPQQNNFDAIRKVLAADRFKIKELRLSDNSINIIIINTKFRSTAQAIGRVASTLQRFTSNDTKFANISIMSQNIITGSYQVDLDKITEEQFNPVLKAHQTDSILAVDIDALPTIKNNQRFTWGLGPYITHRLFNLIYRLV